MTNREIRAIAKQVMILNNDICDNYGTCEACPLHTNWTNIEIQDKKFGFSCISLLYDYVVEKFMEENK